MNPLITTDVAVDRHGRRGSRFLVYGLALAGIFAVIGAVVFGVVEPAALPAAPVAPPPASCAQCGTVEAIQAREPAASRNMSGSVAGGLLGAWVGNGLGGDRGRAILAMLGVAGGPRDAGHLRSGSDSASSWIVSVRLEDGSLRRIDQRQPPALTVGDRVRLVNGNVVARS